MTHIVCVIADPLFTQFPHYQQYLVKARAAVQSLPKTDIFTVCGNNQLHNAVWHLHGDISGYSAMIAAGAQSKTLHPNAQQRQFLPLYKKYSTQKWNPTTKSYDITYRPTAILAEGDKDQLIDANALDDAWTRATNTRKLTPDFVVILDPFNRIAGPPPNGVSIPANVITTSVLHRAIKDCQARGWQHAVIT